MKFFSRKLPYQNIRAAWRNLTKDQMEITVRVDLNSESLQEKALQLMASTSGVVSAEIKGDEKGLTVVFAEDSDVTSFVRLLRKHVGKAEICSEVTGASPSTSLAHGVAVEIEEEEEESAHGVSVEIEEKESAYGVAVKIEEESSHGVSVEIEEKESAYGVTVKIEEEEEESAHGVAVEVEEASAHGLQTTQLSKHLRVGRENVKQEMMLGADMNCPKYWSKAMKLIVCDFGATSISLGLGLVYVGNDAIAGVISLSTSTDGVHRRQVVTWVGEDFVIFLLTLVRRLMREEVFCLRLRKKTFPARIPGFSPKASYLQFRGLVRVEDDSIAGAILLSIDSVDRHQIVVVSLDFLISLMSLVVERLREETCCLELFLKHFEEKCPVGVQKRTFPSRVSRNPNPNILIPSGSILLDSPTSCRIISKVGSGKKYDVESGTEASSSTSIATRRTPQSFIPKYGFYDLVRQRWLVTGITEKLRELEDELRIARTQ